MKNTILFWDTNALGKVALSQSRKQLIEKIVSCFLVSDHLVIRPAELFEGADFYFNEAVNPNGFLYQLMDKGHASLALDQDKSIADRAKWRFNKGLLVDRGRVIKSARLRDQIEKRTYQRAELLETGAWGNFQKQKKKFDHNKIQNELIRKYLEEVANSYFPKNIEKTQMGKFLCSTEVLPSRGHLTHRIKKEWIHDLPSAQKALFQNDCFEAITGAAVVTNSKRYGNKVSPVNFDFLAKETLASELIGSEYYNAELTILIKLLNLLPAGKAMKEKSKLLNSITDFDGLGFVEIISTYIKPKDKKVFSEFLFGKSEFCEYESLNAELYRKPEILKNERKLEKHLKLRIAELTEDKLESLNRIRYVFSQLFIVGITVVVPALIGLETPHAIDDVSDLYFTDLSDKVSQLCIQDKTPFHNIEKTLYIK